MASRPRSFCEEDARVVAGAVIGALSLRSDRTGTVPVRRSDPSTTNQFNHVSGYDQTFVLGGDGTTTIEKFGCSAQRGTNGVLTVTRSLK